MSSYSRFHPLAGGSNSASASSKSSSAELKDVIVQNTPSYVNERTLEQMVTSQGFRPMSVTVDRKFTPMGTQQVDAWISFDGQTTAQAWIMINQGFMKFTDGSKCKLELATRSITASVKQEFHDTNHGEEDMRMTPSPEPYDNASSSVAQNGDWKCSKCNFDNFRGLTECAACRNPAPKSSTNALAGMPPVMPGMPGMPSFPLPGMPGMPQMPGMPPFPMPGMPGMPPMPMPGMPLPGMPQSSSMAAAAAAAAALKPKREKVELPTFHWSCPNCGGSNEENTDSCSRCKSPAYGANYVGSIPCNTILFYDLPKDATEIKIKTCLEDYKRHAARIHLVKEKKYALVQMTSVDEAKAAIKDFERKPPKISHMRIPATFSRKPLSTVLVEQKMEAFKNTAVLKTQSAMQKKLGLPVTGAGTSSSLAFPLSEFFNFDRSSGYFYDPSNGFYYDAKSEAYYNPQAQEWRFWSSKFGNYKPFDDKDSQTIMMQELLLQQIKTQKFIQELHSNECKETNLGSTIACEMFKVFMNQSRFIFQLFADKITEDSHREALQNFEWQMLELRQAVAMDMYRNHASPPMAPGNVEPPPRMDLQAFMPHNMAGSMLDSLGTLKDEVKVTIGENPYKLITGVDPLSLQLKVLVPDGRVTREDLRLCRKCGRVGHSKVTCNFPEVVDEETINHMSRLVDAYKRIHRIEDKAEEKPGIGVIGSATLDIRDVRYAINLQEAFKPQESKVVHVRNIRLEVKESDLRKILSPFGNIVDIFILPPTKSQNGQALVEFDSFDASRRCIQYTSPVVIMGQRIYFEYASRQKITKPANYEQQRAQLMAQIQAVQGQGQPQAKQPSEEPEVKRARPTDDWEQYLIETYLSIKDKQPSSMATIFDDPDFKRFREDEKYRDFLIKRKEKMTRFGY